MKNIIIISSVLVLINSCIQPKNINQEPTKPISLNEKKTPKNVILLIGDGMGLSQVSSTFYLENHKPAFIRFPFTGLHIPSSATHKITDSAAGATAFATGKKSYNGAISKDTNYKDIQTILEKIVSKNISTGIIATSTITHATPACFYAHQDLRSNEEAIAAQLPTANIDFFAGGGLKYFNKRKDNKNLIPTLIEKGFEIDTNKLPKTKLDINKRYGFLVANDGLPSKEDGRDDFLLEASLLALDYLDQKDDNFFLMIEGSQIDWACHAANKTGLIEEMKDFNKVLHTVLDFAEKDGETLVVVTADHETGGFALSPKWKNIEWDYNDIEGTFYGGAENHMIAHTGALIPVFAYGIGAEQFSGVYENTEIHKKILSITGW